MIEEIANSLPQVDPLFDALYCMEQPKSARDLEIIEVPLPIAVELNQRWHSRLPSYRTGFCLTATVCYAAIYRNRYYAVAIWSNPVARLLPQDEWLELRRMAICNLAPRYTATWMLAKMERAIKAKYPQVKRLISYQDTLVHRGTIYKAANWHIGYKHPGGSWDRPHSKNMCGTPRTRPDANGATGPKVRWDKVL